MSNTLKIVSMNLIILAAQAFYMYLSSKSQMKSKRYMYAAAALPVMAYPVILNNQNTFAYSLYLYAVITCIITAAVMDTAYAAAFNKNFMDDERFCGLLYTYLMICAVSGKIGKASPMLSVIVILMLVGAIVVCVTIYKHPLKELFKAAGLAAFSLICAWLYLIFVN